jgi:plasmid stabilization system protein ParE
MDFKVILQPLALDDLEAIVRHVAEKDVQAANRLGMSLLDRAEALAQFPERGGNVRSRPGVKKLVPVPYFDLLPNRQRSSLCRCAALLARRSESAKFAA